MSAPRIAVVVKGYPRLSETFIAQELLALEARGLPLAIWSLRRPTEARQRSKTLDEIIERRAAYLVDYQNERVSKLAKAVTHHRRDRAFDSLEGEMNEPEDTQR